MSNCRKNYFLVFFHANLIMEEIITCWRVQISLFLVYKKVCNVYKLLSLVHFFVCSCMPAFVVYVHFVYNIYLFFLFFFFTSGNWGGGYFWSINYNNIGVFGTFVVWKIMKSVLIKYWITGVTINKKSDYFFNKIWRQNLLQKK